MASPTAAGPAGGGIPILPLASPESSCGDPRHFFACAGGDSSVGSRALAGGSMSARQWQASDSNVDDRLNAGRSGLSSSRSARADLSSPPTRSGFLPRHQRAIERALRGILPEASCINVAALQAVDSSFHRLQSFKGLGENNKLPKLSPRQRRLTSPPPSRATICAHGADVAMQYNELGMGCLQACPRLALECLQRAVVSATVSRAQPTPKECHTQGCSNRMSTSATRQPRPTPWLHPRPFAVHILQCS